MAKYEPRLTAPSHDDKHYYSNENIFHACGYGMYHYNKNTKKSDYYGNCTAYAWGRLYEITGKRYTGLCGNAEDWWAVAEKAGLKRGQEPKLGAIICWRAGEVKNSKDGAGHVAVVEEIKPNGDIVTSNSGWNSSEFYTRTVTKASGYQYSSDRIFQGFIYCGIEFEKTIYRVQAGAYKNLSNADRQADKLNEMGYNTYMVKADGFYKIQVGAYEVKSNAERMEKELESKGIPAFITTEAGEPVGTVLEAKPAKPVDPYVKGTKCKIKVGAKDLNRNKVVSLFACLRTSEIKEVGANYVIVSYKGTTIAKVAKDQITFVK